MAANNAIDQLMANGNFERMVDSFVNELKNGNLVLNYCSDSIQNLLNTGMPLSLQKVFVINVLYKVMQ
jgi:hypothetical protein